MPKTVFSTSTPITSAFLNAVNNIVFDGLDVDGHLPPIADSSLDPLGVKGKLSALLDNLAPQLSGWTGRVVEINQGFGMAENGTRFFVGASQISLPANSSGFIYADGSGNIIYATSLPSAEHLPIARAVSGASTVTSVIDIRDRALCQTKGRALNDYSNTPLVSASYNAVSKQRILLDSALGSFNVSLPLGAVDGDRVQLLDVTSSLSANPVTVLRGAYEIQGAASNLVLNENNQLVELVFIGALNDWRDLSRAGQGSDGDLQNSATVVTDNYQASAQERVLCDSTVDGFTVTLPLAPSDGTRVAISDVGDQFARNPVILQAQVGDTISGENDGWSLDSSTAYVSLFYSALRNDWRFEEVKGVRTNAGGQVETVGDQTINGHKTFQGKVTVPEPVDPEDSATKGYIDQIVAQGVISKDTALSNSNVQTVAYQARVFERVLCDTVGGPFTVSLPQNPSNGSIVVVVDVASSFATNPVTLSRGTKLIEGAASNLILSQNKAYVELIFFTAQNSWTVRRDSDGLTSIDRARWRVLTQNAQASIGDRLAVDTTAGDLVITVPRFPSVGDSFEIARLTSVVTNTITLTKDALVLIEGATTDFIISANTFSKYTVIWSGGPGWRVVQS